MRIAYLTTDEVNPALVRRWTRLCGVRTITPRLDSPSPSAEALVVDFDHLPADHAREIVNDILLRCECRPALVHGYHIPDGLPELLRHRGVTVVVGRLRKRHLLRWLERVAPVSPTLSTV